MGITGWTRTVMAQTFLRPTAIINPNDHIQSYMEQFPVSSNTLTAYASTTSGVSWGTFVSVANWSTQPYHIEIDVNYDEVRLTYLGNYNTPSSSLGKLTIGNQTSPENLLNFVDAHWDAPSGQTLIVGGTVVFSKSKTNVSNWLTWIFSSELEREDASIDDLEDLNFKIGIVQALIAVAPSESREALASRLEALTIAYDTKNYELDKIDSRIENLEE
jgi:hypothetical protein